MVPLIPRHFTVLCLTGAGSFNWSRADLNLITLQNVTFHSKVKIHGDCRQKRSDKCWEKIFNWKGGQESQISHGKGKTFTAWILLIKREKSYGACRFFDRANVSIEFKKSSDVIIAVYLSNSGLSGERHFTRHPLNRKAWRGLMAHGSVGRAEFIKHQNQFSKIDTFWIVLCFEAKHWNFRWVRTEFENDFDVQKTGYNQNTLFHG